MIYILLKYNRLMQSINLIVFQSDFFSSINPDPEPGTFYEDSDSSLSLRAKNQV